MDKLKPCPFCGGEAVIVNIDFYIDNSGGTYGIRCTKCRACSSMRCDSEEKAIEAWNRRVENGDV